MGEANIRRENDPMYGVIPKKGAAPSWVVYRGVLVLVPVKGHTLTFLPANNMLVLDEGAMAILDAHINANPYLLPQTPVEGVPVPPDSDADNHDEDWDNGYMDDTDLWSDTHGSGPDASTIELDTTQQE